MANAHIFNTSILDSQSEDGGTDEELQAIVSSLEAGQGFPEFGSVPLNFSPSQNYGAIQSEERLEKQRRHEEWLVQQKQFEKEQAKKKIEEEKELLRKREEDALKPIPRRELLTALLQNNWGIFREMPVTDSSVFPDDKVEGLIADLTAKLTPLVNKKITVINEKVLANRSSFSGAENFYKKKRTNRLSEYTCHLIRELTSCKNPEDLEWVEYKNFYDEAIEARSKLPKKKPKTAAERREAAAQENLRIQEERAEEIRELIPMLQKAYKDYSSTKGYKTLHHYNYLVNYINGIKLFERAEYLRAIIEWFQEDAPCPQTGSRVGSLLATVYWRIQRELKDEE